MWQHILLAVRRTVGVARCEESLGCKEKAVDPGLIQTGKAMGLSICDFVPKAAAAASRQW